MDIFVKRVLKTIDDYKMINSGETVIVGLSGGFDSVSLLFSLCEIKKMRGFDVVAVHINHCFREDAKDDENYAKALCEKLNVPFYSKQVNVLEQSVKNKVSFETEGRNVRYEFFNEIGKKYGNYKIATAHNANDSVESFFMHLMRGSGLNGLVGIRPVMNNIIRPIIEQKRKDIEAFCKRMNLEPKTDSTNLSDDYKRNDIRHNIVAPIDERCNITTILNAMEIIADENDYLEEITKKTTVNLFKINNNEIITSIKDFNKLHNSLKRRVLKFVIEDNNKQISKVHIDSVIIMANKGDGNKKIELPGGIIIKTEKGMLKICLKM